MWGLNIKPKWEVAPTWSAQVMYTWNGPIGSVDGYSYEEVCEKLAAIKCVMAAIPAPFIRIPGGYKQTCDSLHKYMAGESE